MRNIAEGRAGSEPGFCRVAGDTTLPETGEQSARGCLLLIGSADARSRASHVRAVFGIEDFFGKPNGNRTLWDVFHLEHRYGRKPSKVIWSVQVFALASCAGWRTVQQMSGMPRSRLAITGAGVGRSSIE